MIHNIPQLVFEEFIAGRLEGDGAVEVRKNHSFVSCEQVSIFSSPMGGKTNSSVRTAILSQQLLKIVLSRIHIRFALDMSSDVMVPRAECASH
jgi:hypothetical protein